MRTSISRIGLVAIATGLLVSTAHAQLRDTLQVGDRVRVRVAATRGTTNLFIGNLEMVSPDTLIIGIPGGKGSVILPRAAIAEVSLSSGNESRFRRVPEALPLALSGFLIASVPAPHGPHENAFRNQRYALLSLFTIHVATLFTRKPREKWDPVYRWLEGR